MKNYKAYNRTQAIDIACAIINCEMIGKNDEMTENYDGMPVYTFEDGSYMVDASERLHRHIHVVARDGIDIRFECEVEIDPDGEIETYAACQAQIAFKTVYVNGTIKDIPYVVTDQFDRFVIQTLIAGAIIAKKNEYDQAADVAQFQAIEYFKDRDISHYLTIYNPIQNNPFTK